MVHITNEQVQVDQFNRPFTVPAGVGSGVIYGQQGQILCDDHVVQAVHQLLIALPDDRSFPDKIVGRDPETDLAVVQITASNLHVAALADANQFQVGDWVVAIGNALALNGGPKGTEGVVSAPGRTVQDPADPNSAPLVLTSLTSSKRAHPSTRATPARSLTLGVRSSASTLWSPARLNQACKRKG